MTKGFCKSSEPDTGGLSEQASRFFVARPVSCEHSETGRATIEEFAYLSFCEFFYTIIVLIFAGMKRNERQFAEEVRKAVRNVNGMAFFEKKGIVLFRPEERSAEVNYLLWHSFSRKGIVKFCHSLHFNLRMKLAAAGRKFTMAEPLLITVNYGQTENGYDRKGIVPMCRYNPETGFEMV